MFKALLITEPCLIGNAVIESWVAAGNRFEAIWTPNAARSLARQAKRHGVPLHVIEDLEPPSRPAIGEAEALFTVMSMMIVPDDLIARFEGRAINLHPALLPACKGPVPRVGMLFDGRAEIDGGVSAHLLTDRIDAGDLIGQRPVPCVPGESWRSWDRRLALAAADLFATDIPRYLAGRRGSFPQAPGGYYRRRQSGEFAITADKTIAEARRLLEALRGLPVRCSPAGGFRDRKHAMVDRLDKVIGPAEGRPPMLGVRSAEMDLADGRVRLRRRTRFSKILARWDRVRCAHEARRIAMSARP